MLSSILRNKIHHLATTSAKTQLTRRLYSTAPKKANSDTNRNAVLAVLMGFGVYYIIVKEPKEHTNPRREDSIILEEEKPEKKPEKKMKLGEVLRKWYTNKSAPANSPSQFTILFVMGEPVCKGTNCEKLIKDDGYVFLSVDELLHDEQQREGSEYCEMIKYCSNKELAVPVRVTTKLLEQAMEEAVAQGKGNKFLIDALPRKKDQAIKFEKLIVPARSRIYCISNKNDTVFEN